MRQEKVFGIRDSKKQEKVFGIRDSNFHIPIQDVIGIEAFSSE